MLIFSIIFTILIPITMAVSGFLMKYHPPKNINGFIGYRTELSKKNQQTWDFAHHYCGKLWLWIGVALVAASVVACIIYPFLDADLLATILVKIVIVQTIILLCAILPVENALKKNFNSDGTRKNEVK